MDKSKFKDMDEFRFHRNKYKRGRREREKNMQKRKKCLYSCDEIEMILDHKIPDIEIAKKLGRNTQSIQVIRSKYSRMEKYFSKQLQCEMENAKHLVDDYADTKLIQDNQKLIKRIKKCKH